MNTAPETLQNVFDRAFGGMSEARIAFTPHLTPHEVGTVISVATGIAKVSGLPRVGFEELLEFPADVLGIAFNVDAEEIGVVLLGEYQDLHAGDEVERTGRVMDVAVGDGLLGRVIDPLGRPLDGNGPVAASERRPIERPAPPIMDRAPVTVPLQTGLKVIDALIPIGRGQRELILGDRQTGKTAIAIDAILNQRGKNVICVYCAIGQRASAVAKVMADLRENGAMDYTVVVVAEGNDAPGLAFITPYAATSIAEHFMEAGRDVLIVYDNLTQHAQAYRKTFLSALAADALTGTVLTLVGLPGLKPLPWWQTLAIFVYALVACLGVNDAVKVAMIKWRVLKTVAGKPADVAQQIAKRAYGIFEQRGRQDGRAVEEWTRAEREIRNDEG